MLYLVFEHYRHVVYEMITVVLILLRGLSISWILPPHLHPF